jgi:hypothetical protein
MIGRFSNEHHYIIIRRVLPLNWTVGMPGILAGTVEDALIASVIERRSLSLSLTNLINFI